MTPNDVLEAKAEEEMKAYEAELRKEMGLENDEIGHFVKPHEAKFLKQSRETTTILFGGLTAAHDYLIEQALRGLGYKVKALDCPENEALTLGKEYGNRGQCNPTYYTVGNLVKTLRNLETEGLSKQEINEQYVFLTAGACGPCRFGMYEAEFRKATRDSGYTGFRVLLFDQEEGLSSASGDEVVEEEGGLDFTKDFYMALLTAIMLGDLINDMGHQIIPHEVNKGDTARAVAEAKRIVGIGCHDGAKPEPVLKEVRKLFEAIPCDFTRVKPKVKITGEFWAMTTEGDGNYHMVEWLESEGAQCLSEPVSTWVDYLMYLQKHDTMKTFGLPDKEGKVSRMKSLKTWALASVMKKFFRSRYDKFRKLLGMRPFALPDQKKIHKLAQEYYNVELRGGEGHMEVGKNIYSVLEKKAHMVISVKPFGCMPSTQSDGVQSKVVNDYPECIFIPIETSGDGEINIKSRVQMKLYEAKVRAREEFQNALDGFGMTVEEFKSYVADHKELGYSLLQLPHEEVGVAANLVHLVAKKLKKKFTAKKDLMTAKECEEIAKVEAKDATPIEDSEGECGDGGCPSCSTEETVPGEQSERTVEQTVAAGK
ncbi:MAG: 2-hydroxyglutaryl-CoA dehydratase [Planctomycetota bacterium]|jgi:predicted nucleotide-binding protein (sugar kinase/HSP70/actin superfamily)